MRIKQTLLPWYRRNQIRLVDGGARGELFKPFNKIDKHKIVESYRFEPDPDAKIEDQTSHTTIRKALWSSSGKLSLYMANNPSTSSVFPPDKEWLDRFDDRVGYPPRQTKSILEVEAGNLDDLVQRNQVLPPDFLKLDIHGAEFEALQGAVKCLDRHILGVQVETWTIPVHQNQKLHLDVGNLLNSKGFLLFDQLPISRWSYKSGNSIRSHTNQIIAYENFYLKNLDESIANSEVKMMKLILIAVLYGQNSYASFLVQQLKNQNSKFVRALETMIKDNSPGFLRSSLRKMNQKLVNYLSPFK